MSIVRLRDTDSQSTLRAHLSISHKFESWVRGKLVTGQVWSISSLSALKMASNNSLDKADQNYYDHYSRANLNETRSIISIVDLCTTIQNSKVTTSNLGYQSLPCTIQFAEEFDGTYNTVRNVNSNNNIARYLSTSQNNWNHVQLADWIS